MREKATVLRYLNTRTAKALVFSTLCRIPPLRSWLNYFEDAISFEDVAEPDSLRTLVVHPVRDYGLRFSEAVLRDILKSEAAEIAAYKLTYKMARLGDVTILGSSGVTVDNWTGKAVFLSRDWPKLPRNWMIARPLRNVPADPGVTYINLLGVRKGHRHFAHFFWDTMVPLMVYLKNWHDPAEQVVCLVREDLSAIQGDAFRFIESDWPSVSFRTLRANEKIHCARSIYLAYQNKHHGRDNPLARDYIGMVAELFLRHYGIARRSGGNGRRLYISRNDAVLRRVTNEAEIVAMLDRYGFEPVETGRMPFEEQARLFASAEVIVAPHGAGLANLMFCRSGTKVLEFFPSNYIDDGLCRLAVGTGMDYRHVIGGRGAPPKLAFTVDVGVLEWELAAMLG